MTLRDAITVAVCGTILAGWGLWRFVLLTAGRPVTPDVPPTIPEPGPPITPEDWADPDDLDYWP